LEKLGQRRREGEGVVAIEGHEVVTVEEIGLLGALEDITNGQETIEMEEAREVIAGDASWTMETDVVGEVGAVVVGVMDGEAVVKATEVEATMLTLGAVRDGEVGRLVSSCVAASSLVTFFTLTFLVLEPSPGPLDISLFLEALVLMEGGWSFLERGLANGFLSFFTFSAKDICSSLSDFFFSIGSTSSVRSMGSSSSPPESLSDSNVVYVSFIPCPSQEIIWPITQALLNLIGSFIMTSKELSSALA